MKKGLSYLQVMTWRAIPGGELTWHVGLPRGCDAALRPRVRAAGGPREAQEVHRARTRGRRPRVSTRVHEGASVGRHVAGGRQMEGARVSGPWLGIWGGNANALPHPTFYTCRLFYFIPCRTMFPHDSYLLQVTWQNRECWRDELQVNHVDAMDDEFT